MGFRKAGKFRLSKSGKAVEILLDELPGTLFDYYFYVRLAKARDVIEGRLASTEVSLLVSDRRDEP